MRPTDPSLDILESMLHSRCPTDARIPSADLTSVFRTRLCLADEYRRSRVFLAGDAAHVFPPFGGQGMNLGIQHAYNIGWRLPRSMREGSTDLLEAYEQERRPIAMETIRDAELCRRAFALRQPHRPDSRRLG